MEVSDHTKVMIGQYQSFQQQLQNVLIQKESLKLQNLEIEKALEELHATKENSAYKIVGAIMVNKSILNLKKELAESKESIDLKIRSLEKNEERLTERIKDLQTKLKEVIK